MFNLIKPDENKDKIKLKESKSTLLLGDSLELLKSINDNSIDLIITDPPYLLDTHSGGKMYKDKNMQKAFNELADSKIDKGYDIITYGKEFIRVMKNINIYIWCNKIQIPDYLDFYVKELNCKFDILFWNKPNALPTFSNKYLTDMEYCLYFRNGKCKCFPQSYEDAKTYYSAPINMYDKQRYLHPTIKPLEMIERMVRNSSDDGDVVLDTFMGSGTTGVACKKLNREFIGMEINKDFYKMAKLRIANTKE